MIWLFKLIQNKGNRLIIIVFVDVELGFNLQIISYFIQLGSKGC